MTSSYVRNPIARATLHTSTVLVLRVLMQTGTLLIMAHVLGPANFGAFVSMTALAVTMGSLSTFGVHLLLLRQTSCAPNQPATRVATALATTLFISTLLLLLYLLTTLLWLKPADMSFFVVFAIGVSDIIALPLLQIPAALHQGRGQIARSQLILTLPLGFRLLAVSLVLIWSPNDILGVLAFAYVMASFASLPFGLRFMRRDWPPLRDWYLLERSDWRESSGFAALNLTAIAPNELDKTIAAQILPAVDAGTYAASSRVMGPLVLPVLAMMLSALPRLFREHEASRQNTQLLRITLFAAFGYGVLAAAALWAFAPWIAWLFGEQFAGIEETLRWLALAVPGLTLRYVTSNTLMSSGRPWLRVAIEMIGLLTLLIAALQFAVLGATGMALALACSEWTMAVCGFVMLYHTRREKS